MAVERIERQEVSLGARRTCRSLANSVLRAQVEDEGALALPSVRLETKLANKLQIQQETESEVRIRKPTKAALAT